MDTSIMDMGWEKMYHGDEFYWAIVAAAGVIVLLLAVAAPIAERYKRWKFDRQAKLRDAGRARKCR